MEASPALVVRPGILADLPEVQRLNHALFEYEHDQSLDGGSYRLNWPYEPAGIKFFTNCLGPAPDQRVFIAEMNGHAVGYLAGSFAVKSYRATTHPIAELDNMFVEADYRHGTVGQQLFAAFKTWLVENQVDRIGVSAYAKNTPALRFYHSLGFESISTVLEMPLNPQAPTSHEPN